MLNFDKDRFVKIQTGSVGIAGEVRSLMKKLLGEGVNRLYFMGTGGVQLLTHPAIELGGRRST
jgi:fructoselysine-6-phosphate deglycase